MSKGFFPGSTVRETVPQRLLPQCGACGLAKKCASPKIPPTGEGRKEILIVGHAPSKSDDAEGEHLTGHAGDYLRRELKRLGCSLEEDAWATNAIICHPPKSRQPTSAEVHYCRPNIMATIKELKPSLIIPMGAPAVNAVLGAVWGGDVGGMERWAGWCIPSHDLNAWVCPTWHPDFLEKANDPVLEKQFRDHVTGGLATQGVPWPNGVPQWADNVEHVMDPAKAAKWLRKAATRQTGAIAWDYETNMLKPDFEGAEIISCAVAWGRTEPERCIAFPWHGEAITAMGELLRSPVPKIASNLKFEDRWTRMAFGHRVRAWVHDTMLAAHVCDNRPGITSVKFQAFVRHGAPVWNDKTEPFLKSGKDARVNDIFEEISMKDLLRYNGLDAWLEFMVAVDQLKELACPLPWKI